MRKSADARTRPSEPTFGRAFFYRGIFKTILSFPTYSRQRQAGERSMRAQWRFFLHGANFAALPWKFE
jgi:hypothetical protein